MSSQNAPEGLHVRTLRVHPFLNSLHVASLAAHVLLCLDVGGQIYRLQEDNNFISYSTGRKTSEGTWLSSILQENVSNLLKTGTPGVCLGLYYSVELFCWDGSKWQWLKRSLSNTYIQIVEVQLMQSFTQERHQSFNSLKLLAFLKCQCLSRQARISIIWTDCTLNLLVPTHIWFHFEWKG